LVLLGDRYKCLSLWFGEKDEVSPICNVLGVIVWVTAGLPWLWQSLICDLCCNWGFHGNGRTTYYITGHLTDGLNSEDTSVTLLRCEESKKFVTDCKAIVNTGRKYLLYLWPSMWWSESHSGCHVSCLAIVVIEFVLWLGHTRVLIVTELHGSDTAWFVGDVTSLLLCCHQGVSAHKYHMIAWYGVWLGNSVEGSRCA
jgi:hypothetical protein